MTTVSQSINFRQRHVPVPILIDKDFSEFQAINTKIRLTPMTATTPSVAVYGRDHYKSAIPTPSIGFFESPQTPYFFNKKKRLWDLNDQVCENTVSGEVKDADNGGNCCSPENSVVSKSSSSTALANAMDSGIPIDHKLVVNINPTILNCRGKEVVEINGVWCTFNIDPQMNTSIKVAPLESGKLSSSSKGLLVPAKSSLVQNLTLQRIDSLDNISPQDTVSVDWSDEENNIPSSSSGTGDKYESTSLKMANSFEHMKDIKQRNNVVSRHDDISKEVYHDASSRRLDASTMQDLHHGTTSIISKNCKASPSSSFSLNNIKYQKTSPSSFLLEESTYSLVSSYTETSHVNHVYCPSFHDTAIEPVETVNPYDVLSTKQQSHQHITNDLNECEEQLSFGIDYELSHKKILQRDYIQKQIASTNTSNDASYPFSSEIANQQLLNQTETASLINFPNRKEQGKKGVDNNSETSSFDEDDEIYSCNDETNVYKIANNNNNCPASSKTANSTRKKSEMTKKKHKEQNNNLDNKQSLADTADTFSARLQAFKQILLSGEDYSQIPKDLFTSEDIEYLSQSPFKAVVPRLKAKENLWDLCCKPKKGTCSCSHCHGKFLSLEKFAYHIDENKLRRNYICPLDSCIWNIIGFCQRSEWTRHIRNQHAKIDLKYECPDCYRYFNRKDTLKRHLVLVHNDPPSSFEVRNAKRVKQVLKQGRAKTKRKI